MSGHNKWSTIKHKKAKTDAQRSKAFTKVIKEISVAVRQGGVYVSTNANLRLAGQKAMESYGKAMGKPWKGDEKAVESYEKLWKSNKKL